jgi:hypothetical protein
LGQDVVDFGIERSVLLCVVVIRVGFFRRQGRTSPSSRGPRRFVRQG